MNSITQPISLVALIREAERLREELKAVELRARDLRYELRYLQKAIRAQIDGAETQSSPLKLVSGE